MSRKDPINYIDIIFNAPPGHDSGRFVEAEDINGRSINAGEWIERTDGYWALRIPILITEEQLKDMGKLVERLLPCNGADREFMPTDLCSLGLHGEDCPAFYRDEITNALLSQARIGKILERTRISALVANTITTWLSREDAKEILKIIDEG